MKLFCYWLSIDNNSQRYFRRKTEKMKQMIILLAMIILGIAISAMVLSFQDTAQSLTDAAQTKMESGLGLGTGSGS